jgi:hypothetical protein
VIIDRCCDGSLDGTIEYIESWPGMINLNGGMSPCSTNRSPTAISPPLG